MLTIHLPNDEGTVWINLNGPKKFNMGGRVGQGNGLNTRQLIKTMSHFGYKRDTSIFV